MANIKNTVLETERLILRLPILDDAEDIHILAGDFDIASRTAQLPHPYEFDMAKTWIISLHEAGEESTNFTYAMIRQEDSQLVGACGFGLDMRNEIAGIGYWVGKPYWGNGYASESACRMVQFCFEELGVNRVEAYYFATNIASRRVMEKAGMTYEGTARQAFIREIPSMNHRVYHDLGYCGILRSEWEANRG